MRSVTKNYSFERLSYQLNISQQGNISFGLTGGDNHNWQPEYDPFDYPGKDSGSLYVTDDIGALSNPVRLFRRVLGDLHNWIGAQKPYYFSFYSATEKKHHIYKRMAPKIAIRFGCLLVREGRHFHFYRQLTNRSA